MTTCHKGIAAFQAGKSQGEIREGRMPAFLSAAVLARPGRHVAGVFRRRRGFGVRAARIDGLFDQAWLSFALACPEALPNEKHNECQRDRH